MREIKFKFYLRQSEDGPIKVKTFDYSAIFSGTVVRYFNEGSPGYYIIAKCQYTGLKDKNGKEIYEGDLLNEIRYPPDKNGNYDSVPVFIKENIVQVGFNEGCFTADEAHLWRFISNIGDNEKTDYEIIGNIHENPELLA